MEQRLIPSPGDYIIVHSLSATVCLLPFVNDRKYAFSSNGRLCFSAGTTDEDTSRAVLRPREVFHVVGRANQVWARDFGVHGHIAALVELLRRRVRAAIPYGFLARPLGLCALPYRWALIGELGN